jgi:hypothetical protein
MKPQARPHGQIRQSQIVTTFGPGAMVDLPDHAAIIGGLEHWRSRGAYSLIPGILSRVWTFASSRSS